ncbi:MAG: glycosyltransferase family 2 protein [Burkholderiales bacterium]|nr:glycosyltransferase family 2 protein [Burkholderiales bacterium]
MVPEAAQQPPGQTAPPRVSVALAVRDGSATLRAAMASLIAQSHTDWELLLVDDGSSDDSLQVARSFADSRLRIFADGRRLGLPARLNMAIDAARGAYLARMDADDVAYPERLSRQLAFLDSHPELDLLGAAMIIIAGDGTPLALHPVHTSHESICARPRAGFYLPHPTWCGRIEWFRRWRYDPAYRRAQDQDLLRRAWRESRYAALAEPLVGYRQERLSLAKSFGSRLAVARSILADARRNGRWVNAAGAVAAQGARVLADSLAIATGLERRILRHRFLPLAPHEAARWTEVYRAVSALAAAPSPQRS